MRLLIKKMPNTKTFSVETLSSFPKRLVFLRESGPERKSEAPKAERETVVNSASRQLEAARNEIAGRLAKDFGQENKKGVTAKAVEGMQIEEKAWRKELTTKLPKALAEGIISQRQVVELSDPTLDPGLALDILVHREALKENLDRQLKSGEITKEEYQKEIEENLTESVVEEYPF